MEQRCYEQIISFTGNRITGKILLQRLYNVVMKFSAHPKCKWALVFFSFIESSFFPIPPDILLIPMVLAARRQWLVIALLCTIASVLGGMAGYAIGYYLFESVGRDLLEFYGYSQKFSVFQNKYNEWGAWVVFTAGVTPFPYKVITISSGLAQLDLTTFFIASMLARGLRFFAVALLLFCIGPPIRSFIEKRLGLLFTTFLVLLVGGFLFIKYLL